MQPIFLHEEVAVIFVEPRANTPIPDCCGRVFNTAARADATVLLISSASFTGGVSFVVPANCASRLVALLRAEFRDELKRCQIESIHVQQPAIMLTGRTDGFTLVRELAARQINIINIAHRQGDAGTTALIVQAKREVVIEALEATNHEWQTLVGVSRH
ncbi:MAG: hypothetical protein KF726_06170 [Anaerolineae bacterium]|nr:hypothetical protein [Anaerolineae bacterium]